MGGAKTVAFSFCIISFLFFIHHSASLLMMSHYLWSIALATRRRQLDFPPGSRLTDDSLVLRCIGAQTRDNAPSASSLHQKLFVFPPLAGKTCLMFVVFECVDLADMLSLWCCNPVTKYVLYLLLRIHFLASVALNYNHFSLFFPLLFFSSLQALEQEVEMM